MDVAGFEGRRTGYVEGRLYVSYQVRNFGISGTLLRASQRERDSSIALEDRIVVDQNF